MSSVKYQARYLSSRSPIARRGGVKDFWGLEETRGIRVLKTFLENVIRNPAAAVCSLLSAQWGQT